MSAELCYLNRTQEGYLDYSSVKAELIGAEGVLNFIDSFEFEITCDWKAWARYMHKYWYYSVYAGAIYIMGIFGIQHFMKNRKPFDLKRELFVWNFCLGIFSIFGMVRTAPELVYVVSQHSGFHKSVCVIQYIQDHFSYWSVAFILSKYMELGDTLFIVLRKKPLQLLQWYHHLVTLVVCWLTGPFIEPIGRYFLVMNYMVHSLMYPYFAMRALNVRLPSQVANVITTLQLTQMIVGLFVNSYSAYYHYISPSTCYRQPLSIKLFLFVYGSFAVLFGELFYRLVIRKEKTPKQIQ